MVPLVEDLDYMTQTNLGLITTLQLGQDIQGFAMGHLTMLAAHPMKELSGQQCLEKQQVEGPHPHPYSFP